MSNVLEITKEKVLEASKECPEAKKVFEKLFPSIFKKEWIDITKEIKWEIFKSGPEYWIVGVLDGETLFYTKGDGLDYDHDSFKKKYKIQKIEGRDTEGGFRILKKDGS